MDNRKKKLIKHTFIMPLPTAKEVKVFGSFNNWDLKNELRLKKKKGGWSITLELEPGRYEYKYLVDGVWQVDQNAEREPNMLGTEDSVIIIVV